MFRLSPIPNGLITTIVGALLSACHSPASTIGAGPRPGLDAQVIPTRYDADRFFAKAIIPRGDTAVFFLDTGSGSFVWDAFIPWFELKVDTIVNARGARLAVTDFPHFRADGSLPPIIVPSPLGTRMQVLPVDYHAPNNFVAWIARTTQGQLGSSWFGGRVWTFDYPGRRLLLHQSAPVPSPLAHQTSLYFATDSAGRRLAQTPLVDMVVDGDTISMLFDSGATIWLSADALAKVGDGGPSERSSTHMANWVYTKLHTRHPDWPVIEHADLWSGLSLFRVPAVSVAGFDLGPTWFSVLTGPATPPYVAATVPAPERRRGGTIGGSLLRHFSVTVDYPRAVAWFTRPSS
jgi:hypothetical protein